MRRKPEHALGLAPTIVVAIVVPVVTWAQVAEGPVLHLQARTRTDSDARRAPCPLSGPSVATG